MFKMDGDSIIFQGSPNPLGRVGPGLRVRARSLLHLFGVVLDNDSSVFERDGLIEIYDSKSNEGFSISADYSGFSHFFSRRATELEEAGYEVKIISREAGEIMAMYQRRKVA